MAQAREDERDWTWASSLTDARPPVAQWASLISENIAEMAVASPEGARFRASWVHYDLETLELNFLRSGRQRVTRSTDMIDRGHRPYFELLYAREGMIRSDHSGERAMTPQGGFVLLDDQCAYRLDFPDGSDCLSIRMPQDWAEQWAPGAPSLVGRPLSGAEGWGRPLAAMLTALADFGPASAILSRRALSDQLGAMFMLLGNPAAPSPPAVHGRYGRIVDLIGERHDDPALTPDPVARELSISTRHLHRILARNGTSFGRLLNEARLARAEALLRTRRNDDLPIGDIAWRAGFADPSHFARLFRGRHGCSPTQYRARRRQ